MENELYHHGILGMRWGVRRYQNKDGSLTPAGRERYDKGDSSKKSPKTATDDKSSKDQGTDTTKSFKQMSDKELNEAINRLALEKRYVDLVKSMNVEEPKKNHPYLKRGGDFVLGVLEKSGNNIIPQLITYYSISKINKKIEEKTGVKDALNPKKGSKDK